MTMEWLTDIQKAQLQHCRPDMFNGLHTCERCGGQVIARECLQCSAEHTSDGEFIKAEVAHGIDLHRGGRTSTYQSKIRKVQ